MLAQDPVTGQLYEVPDSQLYGADYAEYPEMMGEPPVVYDGLGNPVGILPLLAPAAARLLVSSPAARRLVGSVLPQAGRIFRGLFGRRRRRAAPTPQAALPVPIAPAAIMPAPIAPAAIAVPDVAVGEVPSQAVPAPMAPGPARWVRPPVPFMGMRPRRVYLRCSAWKGPAGLVPAFATQPVPPPPAAPGVVPAPVVVPVRGRGRRGRRR
jgi:hypothetical protein